MAGDAQIAMGDQFGSDADGDLRHGLRADVETDRRVDAVQGFGRHAFVQQVVEDQLDLALAADHADVARAAIDQVEQGLFVVVVAARHDQAIGIRA